MNTTAITDEIHNSTQEKPGMQLALLREKKAYSQEYVAGKLHLRVRIIELLEADDYQQMPEPVFIKGYLRAYAKLLGVSPDPLLTTFNKLYSSDRKLEKALWQSKREVNAGERFVRWLTGLIAVGAMVAVGLWWQQNKGVQQQPVPVKEVHAAAEDVHAEVLPNKTESKVKLTDLSKLQSLFSSPNQPITPMETHGG